MNNKLRQIILGMGHLAIILLVCISLIRLISSEQVTAQSSRPYAVFVNGQGNCCAHGMNDLQKRLIGFGVEIRYVPYSNFSDGGRSATLWTDDDSSFLRDGANFINNQLDKDRPLLIVGHSYGGDSILKLLPRIKRRIQFVGILDPVATGGWRAPLKKHTVPDTVDYFYNRWQDNVPFPTDFGSDGSIPCLAKKCDQYKQPFVTRADGEVHREKCALLEPCSYKNRRMGHQEIARDEWIQRIIGDRIKDLLIAAKGTPVSIGVDPITSIPNGIRDKGYDHYPRFLADVNGDGIKDFCRRVGNIPPTFGCELGKAGGGFHTNRDDFRALIPTDWGYEWKRRWMEDVNQDGRFDFCRFVGDVPPSPACLLADSNGFSKNVKVRPTQSGHKIAE